MSNWRKLKFTPALFCIVVLGVGLFLFALPYPAPGQAKRIYQAYATSASIAIVGPSTIDYVSPCDSDARNIPAMLAAYTGKRVLDLSVGGQPIIDSINLAAVSSDNPNITDIVLPIVLPQADDWTTPPYRELLVYKLVNPDFDVFKANDLGNFWAGLRGQTGRLQQAYEFEGIKYPDYNTLSATQFLKEKALSACPEVPTHDPVFTKGYFWWTNVSATPSDSLYDLISALNTKVTQAGRRLHVVIVPANLDMIAGMEPGWRQVVLDKQRAIVSGLAARGVSAIDLSDGYTAADFSTPWCACAHLTDKGRLQFAEAVSDSISTEPRLVSDRQLGR